MTRHRCVHLLALTTLLAAPLGGGVTPSVPHSRAPATRAPPAPPLPTVHANDNRVPAGTLHGGVLTVRLVSVMARWYPEAHDGPYVDVAALAEEGGAPQIPAPLIRVPAGTLVVATIRNALPDSTLYVRGLASRPAATLDSIAIPPGASRTVRFTAGAPGTYLYGAMPGVLDVQFLRPRHPSREREQMAGGLVIDSAGARTDDRIFVVNIWGEPADSATYRNALTLNGRSWPYTERMDATVGDTLRWRVINGSNRNHPMHLHGFYFRVDARGTALRDTLYPPDARRLAVTEDLSPGNTMSIAWAPDRPGNWLFHCHVGFHVLPETRLDPPPGNEHDLHSGDPVKHMAGLVLGIRVAPGAGWAEPVRGTARTLHLFVDEGHRRGHAPRALAFVLQRGATPPAPDSVEIPGSVLVLTRGEPTDITVVNRLREGTSIHWHGIELESFSDGVAGWSGAGARMAPVVAPSDSFTARLTLPRTGTFMYHTHFNDIEQLTSGLYGAIVVLEPGQRFDPATDHVFVAGWDGPEVPARLVVNGDSLPPLLTMAVGVPHRLRFVNIGPAGRVLFALRRDTALVTWRARAKDGADLPPGAATWGPSAHRLAVGETFDAEFLPTVPGDYVLTAVVAVPGAGPPTYVRRIRVQ